MFDNGNEPVVSCFFAPQGMEKDEARNSESSVSDDFLFLVEELNRGVDSFQKPSLVACIYNPTIYARQTFELYIRKYCNMRKPIMYFGMNPGPWGMSQTGVSTSLIIKY